MDWNGAMEEERAALMRIVALLRALAGLAELAGSRSPAVRGFVLWILRRAEAAARDFIADDPDTRLALMPPAGCRPSEATRLAVSLRRLARQIERQARLISAACGKRAAAMEPPPFGRMPAMRDARNVLSMLAAFAGPVPHPAPDTS